MQGRYELGKELGRGTFGITYKGYDNHLDKDVAIKVIDIKKSTELGVNENQIMEELETMEKLSSENTGCFPYIACYYDSGKYIIDGRESIIAVSEFVNGGSLGSYLQKLNKPIEIDQLWEMMEQLISALNHVHELGFAHRDIKPDNILRQEDGTIKLIDFGLACTTQCRAGSGTIVYMPPEIFTVKNLTGIEEAKAHDIWSLGVVFMN